MTQYVSDAQARGWRPPKPESLDGRLLDFNPHDWRGQPYDVGTLVAYPRSSTSPEMIEAEVVSIDIVPKFNGGNPVYVGSVRVRPLRSSHPYFWGTRVVTLRSWENITVLPQ